MNHIPGRPTDHDANHPRGEDHGDHHGDDRRKDANSPDSSGPNSGDPNSGDPNGGDPNGGDPNGGDPNGGDPNGGRSGELELTRLFADSPRVGETLVCDDCHREYVVGGRLTRERSLRNQATRDQDEIDTVTVDTETLGPETLDPEMSAPRGAGDVLVSCPHCARNRRWEAIVKRQLERIRVRLGWNRASPVARIWWRALESTHRHQLKRLRWLARELRRRQVTIAEFHVVRLQSGTNHLEANLHFLDYLRLRVVERVLGPAPAAMERPEPIIFPAAESGPLIRLRSYGQGKLEIVKAVKRLTGLSLMDSKRLVDNVPSELGRCANDADAERALEELHAAGGWAEIEAD